MAMSAWLTLVGLCLLYVFIGLWAVSRIFPATAQPHPLSTNGNDKKHLRDEHQPARPQPRHDQDRTTAGLRLRSRTNQPPGRDLQGGKG